MKNGPVVTPMFMKAKKKPYTTAELEAFDNVTAMLSSRDQLTRIRARVSDVPAFVKEHGKEKCDAMFEALQERDKRKP